MNTNMKKIRVGLYGGGRTTPLRAEVISCDHCESCDLYKRGYCLRVTAPFVDTNCKYGNTSRINGYTTRSYKYYTFEEKWKADEAYSSNISRPSSMVVAEVGDYIYLGIRFVAIVEDKDASSLYDTVVVGQSGTEYKFWQPMFKSGGGFVLKQDLEDLSERGLLYQLFRFVPTTLFGGNEIKDYKEKVLPDFVMALKRGMPDLAKRFFEAWPKLDYSPNYVGKRVYINTLPQGIEIKDHHNNIFKLEGDELICNDYRNAFMPFDTESGRIRVKLTGEEIYEIRNNDEVGPNTKFVGVD